MTKIFITRSKELMIRSKRKKRDKIKNGMCPKFYNSWSELERYMHVDTGIVDIHDRGN